MKKLLRYADCLVLLAAIIGCLLRLWLQNAGLEPTGLYRTDHPSWIMLCLLSVGVVVFLWFLTRIAGNNHRFEDNFRPSLVGTGTYLLLAVLLGYAGITDLLDRSDFLDRLTAIATMVSAVMLAVTGIERYGNRKPAMFLHLTVCICFALRMFNLGRALGTEPQICTFLFHFLASVCLVLAVYHLWAFDMNMANRQRSLFWSLTAAYFCLITTFESTDNWALYTVFAAFLLSNLCRLQVLNGTDTVKKETKSPAKKPGKAPAKKSGKAPAKKPASAAKKPAAPAAKPASAPAAPRVPEQQRPVLHKNIDPETDMDAFLADIKQFLAGADYPDADD